MNQDALQRFMARSHDGAVVMLNLLRFVPEGGRERYAEYGVAVGPLLEKAGAEVIYFGDPDPPLLGGSTWDSVLLVRYPNRRAFLAMIGSAPYKEIEHLRSEALLAGELHPIPQTS